MPIHFYRFHCPRFLQLKAIASLLHTDLSHISGERVALGDMNDIRNLVEIMAALSFVRPREGAYSGMPMLSAALQPGGRGRVEERVKNKHTEDPRNQMSFVLMLFLSSGKT